MSTKLSCSCFIPSTTRKWVFSILNISINKHQNGNLFDFPVIICRFLLKFRKFYFTVIQVSNWKQAKNVCLVSEMTTFPLSDFHPFSFQYSYFSHITVRRTFYRSILLVPKENSENSNGRMFTMWFWWKWGREFRSYEKLMHC